MTGKTLLWLGVATDGEGKADDLPNAAGGSRGVVPRTQRGACLSFSVSTCYLGA